MKRIFRAAALALLLLLVAGAAAEQGAPAVETTVWRILKGGSLRLYVSGDRFLGKGFDYDDVVSVTIAGQTLSMPVIQDLNDVLTGEYCCLVAPGSTEKLRVTLVIRGDDLARRLGLGKRVEIEESPGYRWDLAEPYADGIPVTIALEEKEGFGDLRVLRELEVSAERSDYPDLTDEEYANFRNVATTGMGKNALYRGASPLGLTMNRGAETFAAIEAAGIRTVLNLYDEDQEMRWRAPFAGSYYATLNLVAVKMPMEVNSDEAGEKLAQGLRFMIDHEGPYFVHCRQGKDRTGFVCAVLECLMGASAGEVEADYMLTYRNFFGIEPGTTLYDIAVARRLGRTLQNAFGIADFAAGDVDLAAEATDYLRDIGLDDGEIAALKARLAADY